MNATVLAISIGIALLVVGIPALALLRLPKKRPATAPPRSARKPAPETSKKDLDGALQHMALADLLQFLAQGGQSGTLTISSGRRTGTIRLVQGLVTDAEFRRERDLPALFKLLSLEIGDFHFRFEPPPPEHVRGREVVDILMLWLSAKDDGS
ncbi:MAG TPA: DUF4388 domain-containing protein [Fibrobacteria bacterium]|nr:DUF4388 domain-containing protein [Fibrobacteria bacterium]HOX52687.1 DUF4388 domain-containing protein [Fibrobacteria bacterium]